MEEVIRGGAGTIRFTPKGFEIYDDNPALRAGMPARLNGRRSEPSETVAIERPKNETEAPWIDFLDAIRSQNRRTLCPPDLGAAVLTDRCDGPVRLPQRPGADMGPRAQAAGPGGRLVGQPVERRSHGRGLPNQVAGWQAGDAGGHLAAARLHETRRAVERRQGPGRRGKHVLFSSEPEA